MQHSAMPEPRRRALKLYVKLMRATNQTTSKIHRHLLLDNLTQSQFAVLEAVYHLGPLTQGELGAKILKSNANLTTVVDSLEKKKLVQRDRSFDDRRQVFVSLTSSGESLICRVFPRHAEIVETVMTVLSEQEQEQLMALLKKLGTGE
jgi:MarR family 2-MHQ and catechol resistance regulon transcriptional repressor